MSLQQAFSELRQTQNQFDPGPSTAPASIHSAHPLLQFVAASGPSQTGTVTPVVDPAVGFVLSNLNQAHEQVDTARPPASSTSPPSSVPAVSLSPPFSSSPPPTMVSQSILQPQVLPQVGMPAVSQTQGPVQAQVQGQASASVSSTPPARISSPAPAQTVPLVSSPPSSTLTASEVSSDPQLVSAVCSSTTSLSSSVVSTAAIPGPQLAPPAASLPPTPLSSSSTVALQPVTTNVPLVQPTLVQTQLQTATLPGQTHTHSGECDVR